MKMPHKNAKARSRLLRSMYERMESAKRSARQAQLNADTARLEADSANRISRQLLGVTVEGNFTVYPENQARVCVNVDLKAFQENPEAFRRMITERLPREMAAYLSKSGVLR